MKKGSEKVRILIILFSIIFFIVFTPLVSSAPPISTVQQFQTGYSISTSPQEYIIQGKPYQFNFFVFNLSNGLPLTNSSINCLFYLSNNTGNVMFIGEVPYFSSYSYWAMPITLGNFTKIGEYSYGIKCNNSAYGGTITGLLQVTTTGEELTPSESIIYFLIIFFAFFVFMLLSYIFINMEGSNPKGEKGDILLINYKKYVKTALFPLVYVTFLWFFNFIIGLSENYLGLTLYPNTLGFIFMI
jgi:hypothetical protein